MMNSDAAHKSRWEIAEVVFGVPFLVGIGMQFVVPLALPQGPIRQGSIPAGLALIAAGLGVIVMARRELARFGQPTDPGRPTSRLVTTGVFATTRNPLYLAAVVALAGVGLTFDVLWVLVTLPVSMVACLYVLILPEERYLAAKFGAEYAEYAATVNRWFGRVGHART